MTHSSSNAGYMSISVQLLITYRDVVVMSVWLRDEVTKWCCLIKLMCCVPTPNKICHFGDVLPSQSLGLALKKLNPTKQKQATQEKWSKLKRKIENVKSKHTLKRNVNRNQHANFRTVHTCVHIIVHNCCTQYSAEQFWLVSLLISS